MSFDSTVIKIENLTFTYERGPTALKNINLEVKKGEFVAVMGRNGAGKTTLCYLLNGVIPNIFRGTYTGKISVFDINPMENPIYVLAPKCGIVLQNPETQLFLPDIRSELAFGPENLGFPKEEIFKRIEWALKIVRMEGTEDRHPKELSGGQKQRIALAAGLTLKPELLILDEPTSQLDPLGSIEVMSAILSLKEKEKKTILLTTHKTEEAAVADKVVILDDGKIIDIGPPHKILTNLEMLEKHGIKPPEATKLCLDLIEKVGSNVWLKNLKIPITVDEACAFIRELISKGIINVKRDKSKEKFPEKDRKNAREPIIEVRNLTYVYPGPPPVTALKNVSVTIYKGEFIALIGQNGSGKTTLAKTLLGLLKPPKGTVFYKQKDITYFTVGEITRNISLVLQNPDDQLFNISVEKEVEWGLRNLGLPKDDIKRRVEYALKVVGLEDKKDIFPLRLSFGDRRKLAAATAIAMQPEVLIFDEPTTAQDYEGRYRLAEIAKEMNKKGITVIMITHDMELVAKFAERVIVLYNGEILLDGPTAKVFAEKELLKKTFITPPSISYLAQELNVYGVSPHILSVEEFLEILEVKEHA
jgi:energy-coupling factor transport system ATP-binding protein